MITIVACPKPFIDPHVAIIQKNAMRSWARLQPAVEVLVLGNEGGIAEAAREAGVRHIPGLEVNENGTPLLRGVIGVAEKCGRNPEICYINSDVILLSDFPSVIEKARRSQKDALLIGCRTDLDITKELNFTSSDETALRERATREGAPMRTGVDYCVFQRGFFANVPPILIGRPGVDGWMLWYARSRHRLVDMSSELMVIHQSHRKSGEWSVLMQSPETRHNLSLVGVWSQSFTLADATHEFRSGHVRRRWIDSKLHRLGIMSGLAKSTARCAVRRLFQVNATAQG